MYVDQFTHLLNILTDEDKVDAAEAELSDAEEHVGDDPDHPGRPRAAYPGGGGQEGRVRDVGVGQVRGPCPPAQLLGVYHQQMHAVHTDHAHHYQTCSDLMSQYCVRCDL